MMYIERVRKYHYKKSEEIEFLGTVYEGTERVTDGYKYIIRNKNSNSFSPYYEFDTYKEATEFIRYIYGGEITEAVQKAFDYQNSIDRMEIGEVIKW